MNNNIIIRDNIYNFLFCYDNQHINTILPNLYIGYLDKDGLYYLNYYNLYVNNYILLIKESFNNKNDLIHKICNIISLKDINIKKYISKLNEYEIVYYNNVAYFCYINNIKTKNIFILIYIIKSIIKYHNF